MLFWNRSTSYKNRRNSGSHPTFRTEEVGWAPALASGPKVLIAAQSPRRSSGRTPGSHPTFRTEEVGWAPALAFGPKGLIAAQSPVEAPVEPWVLIPPLERRKWDGLRLSPPALKG